MRLELESILHPLLFGNAASHYLYECDGEKRGHWHYKVQFQSGKCQNSNSLFSRRALCSQFLCLTFTSDKWAENCPAQEIITAVMGWNYCCANTQYCLFLTLTSSSPREYTGFWFETLHKRFAHLLPSLWQSLAPTFQRAGHGAWGWCFTQTTTCTCRGQKETLQDMDTHIYHTGFVFSGTQKCFHQLWFFGDWKVAIPSSDLVILGQLFVWLGWY